MRRSDLTLSCVRRYTPRTRVSLTGDIHGHRLTHFDVETLTGLSTVRAYGEQGRFVHNAQYGLDCENRAYYMTIAIQRWLSVRLDMLGNILILGIALFASGFRMTVDPSKIGVVLSYTLSSKSAILPASLTHDSLTDMVSQSHKSFVSHQAIRQELYSCRVSGPGVDIRTE